MFKMNLLPTKSSSSSLIVSIGNTKTANLPYQAPIIVLLYPRVRFSKWSSDLRYQALWLEIWNRSPTISGPDLRYQAFRVKSSILNRRTTISGPYLSYQASCIRFSKWSSDLRYQAPLWEIWTADLPYQAPTYDIKPFELNHRIIISLCSKWSSGLRYQAHLVKNMKSRTNQIRPRPTISITLL